MLQNKIYHKFSKRNFKDIYFTVFGLSLIAWTVRAVNFLELIVDNGYSLSTYFKYSLLNILELPQNFSFSFLNSINNVHY